MQICLEGPNGGRCLHPSATAWSGADAPPPRAARRTARHHQPASRCRRPTPPPRAARRTARPTPPPRATKRTVTTASCQAHRQPPPPPIPPTSTKSLRALPPGMLHIEESLVSSDRRARRVCSSICSASPKRARVAGTNRLRGTETALLSPCLSPRRIRLRAKSRPFRPLNRLYSPLQPPIRPLDPCSSQGRRSASPYRQIRKPLNLKLSFSSVNLLLFRCSGPLR